MTDADYSEGQPVRQSRPARPRKSGGGIVDHPLRDVAVASVFGAIALWAVPKALDFVVSGGLFDRGEEPEEFELDGEDLDE